jgi:dCMP deaminase
MEKRVSWEQYALLLAKTASIRSEDIYKKVGACALSHDNRVLGVSYNGLRSKKVVPSSFWESRDERRPYMIHAETNLLSLFKRDECKLIAVTLLPCEHCARQIVAWNIPTVIYEEEYNKEYAQHTKDIFKFYNVKLLKMCI